MNWGALCVAGLLLVSGCASHETVFRPTLQSQSQDAPFAVSGRLSANLDGKGHVANFEWSHQPGHDELSVNSPLGNTVARVVRDVDGVTLFADGKSWQADDVESLTRQTLGWPLPLANLVWWIRGLPAPGVDYVRGEDGSLQQQGWTIRFVADANSGLPYPKRVELLRDSLTVRLITQDWH